MEEKFLIVLCGLPGTGKTRAAWRLWSELSDYILIDQNEIRRKQGLKKMPKNQDATLREVDKLTAERLNAGSGVIIDSVHRHTSRRHQLYGIASCCGRKVIVLELVCDEETAKNRMKQRSGGDGLLSDPNDPSVYDRLKALWEDITVDFKYPGESHVIHIQFNSVSRIFSVKECKNAMSSRRIKKILTRVAAILGD